MFFAISSLVMEYIERVGLQCHVGEKPDALLGVHELAGPRLTGSTYVVDAPLVRGSPSPASRSESRWSRGEAMSPRVNDAARRRRLDISVLIAFRSGSLGIPIWGKQPQTALIHPLHSRYNVQLRLSLTPSIPPAACLFTLIF